MPQKELQGTGACQAQGAIVNVGWRERRRLQLQNFLLIVEGGREIAQAQESSAGRAVNVEKRIAILIVGRIIADQGLGNG